MKDDIFTEDSDSAIVKVLFKLKTEEALTEVSFTVVRGVDHWQLHPIADINSDIIISESTFDESIFTNHDSCTPVSEEERIVIEKEAEEKAKAAAKKAGKKAEEEAKAAAAAKKAEDEAKVDEEKAAKDAEAKAKKKAIRLPKEPGLGNPIKVELKKNPPTSVPTARQQLTLLEKISRHNQRYPNDRNAQKRRKGITWSKAMKKEEQLERFYNDHTWTTFASDGWIKAPSGGVQND